MEEELFVNGFCKAQNQGRMVICEIEKKADGSIELLDTDCAYGSCSHSGDCLLIKGILDKQE